MRFPKAVPQFDILIIMTRNLSFDIENIEDMVYTAHLVGGQVDNQHGQ